MKICSNCKSDVIEVNQRIALKVILILLLIFLVPYGLFLVWVPFLIPSIYTCKLCGSEKEPVDIDWREYEENKEE